MCAHTRDHAFEAIDRSADEYESKYPKAAECPRSDREQPSVRFDCPAEHWTHLRSTSIIEWPFSTIRLHQRVPGGAWSRAKALFMALKLFDRARERWRKLHGADLPPLQSVQASASSMDYVRREKKTTDRKGHLITRADPQHMTMALRSPCGPYRIVE
jgi:putative transposase